MKKSLLLLTLSFSLLFQSAQAQSTSRSNFASVTEAGSVIDRIMDIVGLQPNFEIRAANNVPNAAAVISGGRRYILYNPNFLNAMNRAAGDQWASISIVAHEIGHHLNGHTLLGSGSTPAIELEADAFSGFVLRKMGATLAQAQSAMQIAASSRASGTHPAKDDRLFAIAEGWTKANNQLTGRNDVARKPTSTRPTQRSAVTPPRVQPKPALTQRQIAYHVRFHSDRSANYYVTTQNNLVRLQNNELQVIGKLSRTNDRNYPLKISGSDTELYVARNGTILTRRGAQVGVMSNA